MTTTLSRPNSHSTLWDHDPLEIQAEPGIFERVHQNIICICNAYINVAGGQ